MIGVRVRGKLKRIYDDGGEIDKYNNIYDSLSDSASAIPGYGTAISGAMKLSKAISDQTVNENGIYHNKGSEVLDNIGINPIKTITNFKDLFSNKADLGSIANTFTGGVFGKSISQKEAEQKVQRKKNILDATATREGSLIGGIANDQSLNMNNQIYAKYGGAIPITKYTEGGNLRELSEENEEVDGNSHANGGVQISPEVEVEGGETINTEGKEPFVFSEKLGFAKLHKPIARAIGKLEKKVSNNVTNDTIKLLKQKEEALKQQQEQFKEQLGLKGVNEYELGGRIKKHSPFQDDPNAEYISMDDHLYKLPKRK